MITDVQESANVGALASAAQLLSHWWSRPASAEVDNWLAWHPQGMALAQALGAAPLAEASIPVTPEERRRCLEEYDRLFVGPGHVPCPPYESFWREDVPTYLRRSLMGPCTEQLRVLYQELGLRVAATSGELPDQLAVQFEALAVALSAPRTVALAHVLLAEHLARWLPKFCRAVTRESSVPFYRDLASATAAWLPILTTGAESAMTP